LQHFYRAILLGALINWKYTHHLNNLLTNLMSTESIVLTVKKMQDCVIQSDLNIYISLNMKFLVHRHHYTTLYILERSSVSPSYLYKKYNELILLDLIVWKCVIFKKYFFIDPKKLMFIENYLQKNHTSMKDFPFICIASASQDCINHFKYHWWLNVMQKILIC
jgi:hypothetical protein